MRQHVARLLQSLAEAYGFLPELMSAALALLGAAWWGVLYPHAFGTIPTYRLLAMIAPERAWAAVLLVLGTVQLVGVFRAKDRWRDAAANFACSTWAFLAVLYFSSAATSMAGPTYAVLAASQAWCFWRPNNPPLK